MSDILANSARPPDFVNGNRELNAVLDSVDQALKERSRKYALAAGGYEKYGTVTSWLERAKNIAALFDEESRFAAILDLGGDAAETIFSKFAPWVLQHPYFVMHKVHLQVLVECLKAFERVTAARDLWEDVARRTKETVAAANQATTRATDKLTLAKLNDTHKGLLIGQWMLDGTAMNLNPAELRQYIAKQGGEVWAFFIQARDFEDELDMQSEDYLGLLMMAKLEQKVIAHLQDKFEHQRQALSEGNGLAKIGAARLKDEQDFWVIGNKASSPRVLVDQAVRKLETAVMAWAGAADAMERQLRVGEIILIMLRRLRAA